MIRPLGFVPHAGPGSFHRPAWVRSALEPIEYSRLLDLRGTNEYDRITRTNVFGFRIEKELLRARLFLFIIESTPVYDL